MGTMLPTILELERQKKEIKSSKNMSLRGEESQASYKEINTERRSNLEQLTK